MISIQTRSESRRGCGFRKPGGIYLVGPPEGQPCCKLPKELSICPCCGAGIKPSRGWTWVDVSKLFFEGLSEKATICRKENGRNLCPLAERGSIHMAGLIWIGEQFYPTLQDFTSEANKMGVSRRISVVPHGFELGKTWVLLAHRKGIQREKPIESGLLKGTGTEEVWIPAIFSVFKPTALEYVVTRKESEEDLERLAKRGMTLVDVNPRRPYI